MTFFCSTAEVMRPSTLRSLAFMLSNMSGKCSYNGNEASTSNNARRPQADKHGTNVHAP